MKNKIIEIIKQNPNIPYEELKKQVTAMNIPVEDFDEAWKKAQHYNNLKKNIIKESIFIIKTAIIIITIIAIIFCIALYVLIEYVIGPGLG